MNSAALGIAAVLAGIQSGWSNLHVGSDVQGVRSVGPVISVTFSRSPESDTSHKDNHEVAEEHMSYGIYYLDNGNYSAAHAEFTRALGLDPKSWLAYLLRAYLYQLQRKNRLAIQDLDRSIELNPTVEAHVMRGVAYAFSGDDDAALKDYVAATGIDPDYGSTYKQRAYIYLRRGNFAEAESDIKEAIRLLPNDLEVQHSFGDVLYYAGKRDAAIRQWQEMCSNADASMTRDWQRRLITAGRYHGAVDGNCDHELIDAFAACARNKCQF